MSSSYVRTRQTPGGSDGSFPGDEGSSSPRRGNSGRGQPLDHQRSKTPQRITTGGSPDGDPRNNGYPGDGRPPSRRDQPRGGRPPGPPGGGPHLVHLETLGPQEIKDPWVHLDPKVIEDLWDHNDL